LNLPIKHSTAVLLIMSVMLLLLSACTRITPPLLLGPVTADTGPVTASTLKLLTLNIAHGRKDSLNQMLVSSSTIRNNLDDIAGLLMEANADVVALQEADGPSAWSGYFNHVSYLASVASYPWDIYSAHVNGKRINYGTALLSRVPFQDAISHDFPESPPTLRKGFTLGQIEWQPDENKPPIAVDILSVHLDFSRSKVRKQQISDILRILEERNGPTIILGDFNSDWLKDDSVVKTLAECGNTKVYKPNSINHGTYKSGKHRLDWVLLSDELEFKQYQVLPDIVSDHQAIIVEVAYTGDPQQNTGTKHSGSAKCNDLAAPAN